MQRPKPKRGGGFKPRAVLAAIVGLAILSAAIYLINFKIYGFVPMGSGLTGLEVYVLIFLFLGVIYLSAVFLVLKSAAGEGTVRGVTGVIFCSAIIFRLSLIAAEPTVLSKDMYRYIWDGRVQQSGINPYRYPPGADELAHLRDDRIFPNINRQGEPTIYPAGAQLFFRFAYALMGDNVTGHKGIMVLLDILTLLVLAALLRALGLSPARIVVYAWNPLVIFEIAYSGHLEGLTVFLLATALYLVVIHRKIPATILLALATAVKLYPALLLAAFLNRGSRIAGLLAFAATFALLYLPFIGAGGKIAGFLPVYLNNPYESFNLGLKYLLMGLIPGLDYGRVSWLFIAALAVAAGLVFLKEKKSRATLRYAYILTGLLLVLMPAALHPWYVILIIPFLVIYPNPAWLIFSCTVSLSYLKYTAPRGIMPTWVLLAEYLSLFVILTAGFLLSKYTGRDQMDGLNFNRKKEELAGG